MDRKYNSAGIVYVEWLKSYVQEGELFHDMMDEDLVESDDLHWSCWTFSQRAAGRTVNDEEVGGVFYDCLVRQCLQAVSWIEESTVQRFFLPDPYIYTFPVWGVAGPEPDIDAAGQYALYCPSEESV